MLFFVDRDHSHGDGGQEPATICHALLFLSVFSVVFHRLLLYVCLLLIVKCALDMLLIKATYLLTYLLSNLLITVSRI